MSHKVGLLFCFFIKIVITCSNAGITIDRYDKER